MPAKTARMRTAGLDPRARGASDSPCTPPAHAADRRQEELPRTGARNVGCSNPSRRLGGRTEPLHRERRSGVADARLLRSSLRIVGRRSAWVGGFRGNDRAVGSRTPSHVEQESGPFSDHPVCFRPHAVVLQQGSIFSTMTTEMVASASRTQRSGCPADCTIWDSPEPLGPPRRSTYRRCRPREYPGNEDPHPLGVPGRLDAGPGAPSPLPHWRVGWTRQTSRGRSPVVATVLDRLGLLRAVGTATPSGRSVLGRGRTAANATSGSFTACNRLEMLRLTSAPQPRRITLAVSDPTSG